MCSIAVRSLPSRLSYPVRAPMRCRNARFYPSRCERAGRAQSPRVLRAAWPPVDDRLWQSAAWRSDLPPGSGFRLLLQAFQLLLQGDHFQLASNDHFLELLEVEDLFLELALGL